MTTKEKAIILFALTALTDKLNITDDELITTKNLTDKFNQVIKENKNILSNNDELRKSIASLFKKYVNKLGDTKVRKDKNEKGG